MALFRKPTAKAQFWGSFCKRIWKHFNLKVICNSAFYSWLIIVYYTTCMCLGDDCVHVHWTVSPYSITYKSSGLNKVGSRNNQKRGQSSISGKTFFGNLFAFWKKSCFSHKLLYLFTCFLFLSNFFYSQWKARSFLDLKLG